MQNQQGVQALLFNASYLHSKNGISPVIALPIMLLRYSFFFNHYNKPHQFISSFHFNKVHLTVVHVNMKKNRGRETVLL